MLNAQTKQAQVALDAQNKSKDRESRQNIEVMKLASTVGVHNPVAGELVNQQVAQLAPLMTNIKQHPAVSGPQPPPMPARPPPMGLGGLGRQPMQFAPPPPPRFAPPSTQGFRP
jgi:hypothetical protein